MIKKLPIPIAGLMLGLVALGNLLASYSPGLRMALGFFATIIGVLLILKAVLYWDVFKAEMDNPIVCSVSAAFSMAVMLLSGYIKPLIPGMALPLWLIGVALHLGIIIKFAVSFLLPFDIKKIFPTVFVTYVGFAAAAISAPGVNMTAFGRFAFYFGLLAYIGLLPIILYRVVKIKSIPEPAKPLTAIFAAPPSLCLAGYFACFEEKSVALVLTLLLLAVVSYLTVLWQIPSYIKAGFYPSYSALTFPMVISAIAFKQSNVFLTKIGIAIPFASAITAILTVIASILVLYVAFKYLLALTAKAKA